MAGVPLSSVQRETVGYVVPFGCDDVCSCSSRRCGKQKAQLVLLLPFLRVNDESLACRMAPCLQLVWKRGPLAPVVVVGEGQVNLVFGRCSGHGESLQSFVVDDLEF